MEGQGVGSFKAGYVLSAYHPGSVEQIARGCRLSALIYPNTMRVYGREIVHECLLKITYNPLDLYAGARGCVG